MPDRRTTADLHLHSTASDGTDPPERLPELARAAGVGAMALTDHDTTAGVAACAAAAEAVGVAFVPGIELSADPRILLPPQRDEHDGGGNVTTPRATGTLHILGLFIDGDDPTLRAITDRLRAARDERNPQIVANLNALGIAISDEEVREAAGGAGGEGGGGGVIVGRPHIAQVLLRKGYVKSIHEAFVRYIGEGGPAYARKDRLTAARAIDAIHAAGGLASLAHPVQLRLEGDELDHAVAQLARLGLDAIEAWHSDHTGRDTRRFHQLADRHDLLLTGGSDYHGSRKSIAPGSQNISMTVYEDLDRAWRSRRRGITGGDSEA